jgi:uncharacterized protein YprB with RNaseH-like and TPR domain
MLRQACFDLETSTLDASFGVLLCAVIKEPGQAPLVLRADELNKNWTKGRSDDSAIVRATADALAAYDLLAAHNGKMFDLPFLRTRLARWGLPPFPDKKFLDPYLLARNKFRLRSNSLDAISDLIDANIKTRVSPQLWARAAYDGDREAMDAIVDHCVRDVEMLERVFDLVKGYSTAINTQGSGW